MKATTNEHVTSRDSTVVKIDSRHSPRGAGGEKYLASGVRVAMRLWDREPPGEHRESQRDYEVIGYVLAGRAELHVEGQLVVLEAGHSYVVPRGARHHYKILEEFSAVEATSPPYHVHGRDAPQKGEGGGESDDGGGDR
jgi:quercetin dioxygenase-like cupin family protein